MAPTIASGQKKNRRLGLFVFVVSFGARPVSKCKVHDFVLVHVIACLLFFLYLFRLATRNGSSHCIGPKKTGDSALPLNVQCESISHFVTRLFYFFKIVNV